MRQFMIALCGCSYVFAIGCDSLKPPPSRQAAKVAGVITFREQPLERGQIIFIHESGEAAVGEIHADGTYALTAPVGLNRIMIRSHAKECRCSYCAEPPIQPSEWEPSVDLYEPENRLNVPNSPSPIIPPTLFMPERYENHMVSELTFDVRPGVDNSANFPLTD